MNGQQTTIDGQEVLDQAIAGLADLTVILDSIANGDAGTIHPEAWLWLRCALADAVEYRDSDDQDDTALRRIYVQLLDALGSRPNPWPRGPAGEEGDQRRNAPWFVSRSERSR